MRILLAVLTAVFGLSPALADDAKYAPQPYVQVDHAAWTKTAAIYQLNTRQFTPEGTFAAAAEELPRIKALGADIVWLMPIHPIGEVNRKGSLGSPYAVKDFRAVNSEFGTLEDFKAFVDEAHALGLKVIIDWVANHSAWDNHLVEDHPEWYSRTWDGNLHPTIGTDWDDIIEFDYDQAGLRRYMTEAMRYWVEEVGVDGFRCDVAGLVPLDFWETLRAELESVKPVFMLAEWETRDMHRHAFDATYAWKWKEALQDIAQGRADARAIAGYYNDQLNSWPRGAMRMTYVSNHDQNSWDGTPFEIYGDAMNAAIVLSVVGEGMPLIYNGQEAGNDKRLEFFERDPIVWREHPVGDLYARLFQLKGDVSALWNGRHGAPQIEIGNDAPSQAFSFARFDEAGGVFAVFNLSPEPADVAFEKDLHHGAYAEFLSGDAVRFDGDERLALAPWEARVYVRQSP